MGPIALLVAAVMFLPEASFYQQSTNMSIPVDRAIDCLLPKMAHLRKANDYVCLRWFMGAILFCAAVEEYGRHPNDWL